MEIRGRGAPDRLYIGLGVRGPARPKIHREVVAYVPVKSVEPKVLWSAANCFHAFKDPCKCSLFLSSMSNRDRGNRWQLLLALQFRLVVTYVGFIGRHIYRVGLVALYHLDAPDSRKIPKF